MVRPVKLLIPAVTVAVVLGAEAVHSRLIARHPYGLTAEPRFGWTLVFIGLIWLTSYVAGLPDASGSLWRRAWRAVGAVGAAALLISIVQLFNGAQLLPRFVLFVSATLLIPMFAAVSSLSLVTERRRAGLDRVLAVVGDDESERLRRELEGRTERPAQIVALVRPGDLAPTGQRPQPLADLLRAKRANLLVLDREAQGCEDVVAQAAQLHSTGARVRTLSMFYDEWLGKLPISELERISLLFDINEIHRPVYARTKRFLDVVLALLGVVALAAAVPIILLVNLAGNRGPLLYRQARIGKDGTSFIIYKFRTMAPGDGVPAWTTVDDPRLGRVGRALRRLHVDELPQVWNVLRRDLSIVGPRPEQPHYVETLAEKIRFYELRHLVRPGITGWAQVKYDYGASDLDAMEKLQYEFYYLRHQSLGLDLRIMGRTLRAIAGRHGR